MLYVLKIVAALDSGMSKLLYEICVVLTIAEISSLAVLAANIIKNYPAFYRIEIQYHLEKLRALIHVLSRKKQVHSRLKCRIHFSSLRRMLHTSSSNLR